MYWLAHFEDHPDRLQLRADLFDAHVDYLARHAAQIILAGGVRTDEDAAWSGGVWIIAAMDRAAAAALCETDPFYAGGLRKSYTISQWGRAPCYGPPGSVLV